MGAGAFATGSGGAGCGLEDMAEAKPKAAKPIVKVSARKIMLRV
jgi:hypothetical protein